MKAISFAELTNQVHLINDMILSDMTCGNEDPSEAALNFSRHLLATKYWFVRISWANKKRYVLALLEDVRSAWALSLLLKSLWNCRPKDAVMSVSEQYVWSSFDQIPMDHNRTALPVATLAQVMKNDRMWFLTLDPEAQAMVLSELLTVAGGPVMWVVLKRAQTLYERYRNQQLQNLQECIVVNDPPPEKVQVAQPATSEKGKKEAAQTPRGKNSGVMPTPDSVKTVAPPGQAQRELEANLAQWNATIKSLRDSLKLEELEMTFNDGTKRKIWKVNRPKPEAIETVDFIQLLPSSIGKRIMSYLPRAQLGDYARVNKYWAYLVDEFRAELAVRAKITLDYEKLHDNMLRHDTSMQSITRIDTHAAPPSSLGIVSTAVPLTRAKQPLPSTKASEKSGGAFSMRHFLNDKLSKPSVVHQTPIRNMAELTERLEQRGAADENIWKWCDNILNHPKKTGLVEKIAKEEEGVLCLGNIHFPCPMMKKTLEVPLNPPLYKDPAVSSSMKPRRNISDATVLHVPKEQSNKRYSLWMRDFSGLYPVFKIPSHQSPI